MVILTCRENGLDEGFTELPLPYGDSVPCLRFCSAWIDCAQRVSLAATAVSYLDALREMQIKEPVGETINAKVKASQGRRVSASDPNKFPRFNAELGEALGRRRDVEALPAVPLSQVGRQPFSLGAAGPVLIALGNLVFTDGALKTIYNSFLRWLSPLLGG